jgi:hypothetical protein
MPLVKCSQCGASNDPAVTSGYCDECGRKLSDSTSEYPELGELRKTYRAGSAAHWGAIIGSLFLCLLLLAVPVLVAIVAPAPQDLTEWLLLGLLLLVMGGGYAALMYAVVLPGIADLKLRVHLHEAGLAIERGRDAQAFKWNEIESVRLKVTEINHAHLGVHGGLVGILIVAAMSAAMKGKKPRTEFTIRTHDGQTASVSTRVKDSGELADAVQGEVTALRLPEARAEIERGREVAFDGLSVSDKGLHKGGTLLPWRQLKEVKVEGANLIVRSKKGWFPWYTAGLPKVPNVGVLRALVDEYTRLGEEDAK